MLRNGHKQWGAVWHVTQEEVKKIMTKSKIERKPLQVNEWLMTMMHDILIILMCFSTITY